MSEENKIPAIVDYISTVRNKEEVIILPKTVASAITCENGETLDKYLENIDISKNTNVLRVSESSEDLEDAPAIDADRLNGLTDKDFVKGTSSYFANGETILHWANNNNGIFNKFATTDYGIPEDAPVQSEGFVELFIDKSVTRKEVRYSVYGEDSTYKRTIYGTEWDGDWINIASSQEIPDGVIYVDGDLEELPDEVVPMGDGLDEHDCTELIHKIFINDIVDNHNLIKNPYLKNPVNTSGLTSWIGDDIVCVNEWIIDSRVENGSHVELTKDGLNISINSETDADYSGIYQYVNKLEDGIDYMLSLSIDNNVYSIHMVGNGILSGGVDVTDDVRIYYITNHPDETKDTIFIRFYGVSTTSVTVNWVKLEYGKIATPFIIPNKEVERLKCGDYSVTDAKTFNGLLKNRFMGINTNFEYDYHNYDDLNKFKSEHHAFVFNMDNSPEGFTYGFLDVSYFSGTDFIPTNGKPTIRQVLTCWYTGHVWIRIYNADTDTWNDWRKISVEPENFVKQYNDKEVPLEIVNDPTYNDNYEGCINGTVALSIGLPDSWWNIKYMKFMNYGNYGIQIAFPISYDMNIKYRKALGTEWMNWEDLPLLTNNSLSKENLGFGLGYGEVRADGNHIRIKAFNEPFNESETTSLMVLNSNYASKQDTLQLWRTENGELSVRNVLHEDNYSKYVQPIYHNAGYHNANYRGKYLGDTVTEAQWNSIKAGTFEDLYIGDYWTINGINYRIAAFDYYLNTGDIRCTAHHVVIVPDSPMYYAQMNNTSSGGYEDSIDANSTDGGYVNSDMYTTNLNQAKETIKLAFGHNHILKHRQRLSNAVTDGYVSRQEWYDSEVNLMTEINVYGCIMFSNFLNSKSHSYNYTIDRSQYPLFAQNPSLQINGDNYWLRDVASSMYFCFVNVDGTCSCYDSSRVYGVRPAFSIC